MEFFGCPVLAKKCGLTVPTRQKVKASLGRKAVSPLGAEEFIRVKLGIMCSKTIRSDQKCARENRVTIMTQHTRAVDAGMAMETR